MNSQPLCFKPPLSTPITLSLSPRPSKIRPPSPTPPPILHAPPYQNQRLHVPYHIYRHPSAVLLELCSSLKELHQFIPLVVKNGLYAQHLFQTKFVALFCKFGAIREAACVFEPIDDKLEVLYHTMLKGYARKSHLDDAFLFFCRMKRDGVRPTVYDFAYLLKACGENSELKMGTEVHSMLISHGFSSNMFASTAVVNMYAKCRRLSDAYKVFNRMPVRDLVAWNALIAGYAQNGMAKIALELVIQLQEEGQRPDSITIVSILPATADIRALILGKSIHGYAIRTGFDSLVNVSTALLDMYAKCGSVSTARVIFDGMCRKTIVSWNSMIDGYAQSGMSREALSLLHMMLDEGVEPTNVTVMEALHACAELGDLEQGMVVHKLADDLGLGSDVSVRNSLISMYSKCKNINIASKIFEDLQCKTLVSWNAMILGYAQNGHVSKSLNYYFTMQKEGIKPDSFTMVSTIAALAELSLLRQAKWIHGHVVRTGFNKNIFVMTALVDMYSKCGTVHTARKLFNAMDERHVTTWNAMIDGYGTHGFGQAALELFSRMQWGLIKPNKITFLSVISACSHSGLVEEGKKHFATMKEYYGLEPEMDHYGAMVDLLGRAGKLDEAWEFIQHMPIKPGISVFGAMLGACKIHKNVELGEKAANELFNLNPEEGGYHVLLSNIFATASKWDKVARVRTAMEKQGIQKTPGCSLVELRNEIHTFYSGSTSHPQYKQIYARLESLGDEIKVAGYVPDTSSIHDVEDEVKVQLLNSHSERLAIAFGLLNTSPGTTIHIRKNLRVCGDCHNATKYISLVTGREIIVRDLRRFHHFKNGTCSCGDSW